MTERSSDRPRKKKKRNASFWRASRYLLAYRRIIAISVICAFFVGGAFTGGLLTTLPIIKVLISRDSVPAWADRMIVEHRLGVTLAEEQTKAEIVRISPNDLADKRGFHKHDVLTTSLLDLSAPGIVTADNGHGATATLPPVPFYFRWLRGIAMSLPINPVAAIAVIFGCTMLLSVIGNVLRFFQEYLSDKAAIAAITDVRRHLYDHVLHLPMGYFGIFGTSDVTSRLVQDSQALQDGFKTLLGPSIQEPIKAGFTLGVALWLNWRLTMFIIIFAPLMATMIRRFGKKMRRANRSALQKSGDMLGQIESTLQGVRVVKAVGAERFERRRYSDIMAEPAARAALDGTL